MIRQRPTTALAALAVGLAFAAPSAAADPPRTSDGHTDFTGTWTNASLTPLTRARTVNSLVVSKEEARKIAASTPIAGIPANDKEFNSNARYSDPSKGAPEKGGSDFGLKGYDSFWVTPGDSLALVKGEYRTSAIVDPPSGQLPYKDPTAIAKSRQAGSVRYLTGVGGNSGPEDTNLAERCLIGFGGTGGPGMLGVLYNNNYEFVQTPNALMILVEMDHDARIVPLFRTAAEAQAHHKPNVIKPWLGDSVGWWEGDTLAIETVNVNPQQAVGHPFALSAKAKTTERLTRQDDGTVFYQFTVDDPDTYTQAWRAELSFRPIKGHVYEYACHEGNYAMPHMLAGTRLAEREEAEKARAVAAPAKPAKPKPSR